MADFKRLKKKTKNRFGDVSDIDSSNNLEAPEVAPPELQPVRKARSKTGRTEQFATKVTKEFEDKFRTVAFHQRLKKVELLERCFELYCKEHGFDE